LGTLVTILVPVLLLPVEQAMSVFLVVVLVTLGASYYGNLIIGGVIGDFLGATIQVCELCVYLLLSADLKQTQTNPFPLVMLAATAVLPILTSRPLIDFGFRAEC